MTIQLLKITEKNGIQIDHRMGLYAREAKSFTIILVAEIQFTNEIFIKISKHITNHPDRKDHGGIAIVIEKTNNQITYVEV